MKASEFIKLLKKEIKEHGDLNVTYEVLDMYNRRRHLREITGIKISSRPIMTLDLEVNPVFVFDSMTSWAVE